MDIDEVKSRFQPAVQKIITQCEITDDFVDKDLFRVYLATIWGNAVLDPEQSGLLESDLPALHDFLNETIPDILGPAQTVTSIYEYLLSEEGDDAMTRLQVTASHREFINHFAQLMLSSSTG